MQKLFKRAAQAQRQAGKRVKQLVENEQREAQNRQRRAQSQAAREVRQNLKDARSARREEWELGPLAPKRDIGTDQHGVFEAHLRANWSQDGSGSVRPKILEKRCAWAGGVRQLNLAPQDRVVILEGPDKGKIDKIEKIDTVSGSVTLEKLNKSIAASFLDSGLQASAMPLPISAVRLVYPLKDPNTGITRDVVVNQLKAVPPNMSSPNMSLDRWEHGRRWDRVVPSLNVVIPWPEFEAPKFEPKKDDTERDGVEQRTFYYNLLSPPMPEPVIDELRNKFSKFRTRHEAWYIMQKEQEAQSKLAQRETVKAMQTPLDEFHEKQRELREARGEPELTEEMLEKLGQIMAEKKAAALDNAGATIVSTASGEASTASDKGPSSPVES